MTNMKFWTFSLVLQLILCTSIVSLVDGIFEDNIAINKNVKQSSTYTDTDVWSANNAVDGNKNCTQVDKDHYSLTTNETVPWWQVNLGNIYSLSNIIVHGRPNEQPVQLKGFVVYLSTSANGTNKTIVYTNTAYANRGIFTITVQPSVAARYVRIEMPGTYRNPTGREGPLALCEVEVYPKDIIQDSKNQVVTSMSRKNTYYETSLHWDKDRAIDGVRQFNPDICGCCSATSGTEIPWWKLDLTKPYLIAEVMIYGRSDNGVKVQSENLSVYGSNSTTENGTELYNGNPNRNNTVYSISLQPPRLFQVLTIRRWTISLMTICEVKMFQAGCVDGSFGDKCLGWCNCKNGMACDVNSGHCDSCPLGYIGDSCQTPCDDGKYGQNCSESCSGHCNNGNQQCNKTNGYCMHGCADGYEGIRCEKGCPQSTYGQNCSKTCNTCTQMKCENTKGLCTIGCVPGFKPNDQYCKEACDDGKYGQNCSKSCSGHCYNGNQQCNKTNGYCMQDCADGYKGIRCEKECDLSRYGKNCSQTCNTCEGMSCNNKDGFCHNGCVPGYKYDDTSCRTECPVSTYGKNCSQTCSTCEGMSCNNTDGLCDNGCVPGYTFEDLYCNTTCPASTYGTNCSQICSTCEDMSCNSTDGSCLNGCIPGYKFDDLHCNTTCDVGSYGRNCSYFCSGNCLGGNEQCEKMNGTCMHDCDRGFFGDRCESECVSGSYSYNCNETCHHCKHGTVCNSTTGSCPEGCSPSYYGTICDQECSDGYFGDCTHSCHCSDGMPCLKTDGFCEKGCDFGWDGKNCSLNQNLILRLNHVHTEQTGELKNYTSSKAIDGKDNNAVDNCNCCSVTNGSVSSWWQIDLGDKYLIDTVRIYGPAHTGGRNYQLENAAIYASNHTMVYNTSTQKFIYRIPKNAASVLTQHLLTATIAQFFIVKSDEKSFTLCEFELFEKVCDVGRFGTGCNHTCHCSDNNSCDSVTGKCKAPGCFSGWSGDSCNLELSMGSESHSVAIGGGIGTAVALVIIAVIIGFIIYRRRNVKESSNNESQFSNLDKALDSRKQRLGNQYRSSMNWRENGSFEGEEETSMTQSVSGDYYSFEGNFGGIRIYELWDCIKEKMENECAKFYSEFKRLPSGLVHPCKTAENLVNKGKNRYKDMYAYDHTRVVLLDIEEGKNTDYINACYIDGYDKTKKFVASQGPTKQMINDFWRMVWQLKSDKIVMLTDLIEMGTVKCLQYWPLEDEEEEHCFGKVTVKVLNTERFLDYNIRLFEVRKNGEPARRIRQFHFKSWPDKDVPDSTWCLVNFWRAVNTNEPSTAGPIVVHCSAGVGRTGTFIALDNLVSQAKAEGCVRPLQVVETLRRQRVNMVQTREQYVYLHEAVADALLFGTHYVFAKQFGDMFSFMLRKENGETKSNLEKQFELIEKSTRDTTSDAAENVEYTNVETIQSESEAYRPKLKKRGSRFVQELGAMYIPNYKGKNTFLISMSPDKNTMEEFWSLVDDSHIKTIIMLTETSAPCYQASSQLGANSKNGSKFSVNKIEEKIRKGFTERSFCFKESDREEEEYLTTVKQFEYTDWEDGSAVPGETKHMLDMINSIQKWQSYLSESQPILIHCSDGFKRSGIICVLLNELQRIQYEGGLINILESVKMMKKRQKFMIPTYEEYRFCFDLILAHSKTTEVYANI